MRMAPVAMLAVLLVIAPCRGWSGSDSSPEALERYWECMERSDLAAIRELLWYHHSVARVDASLFGLPADDLDDRSLLTIAERLEVRRQRAAAGKPLPDSGSRQYPHFLRQSFDNRYRQNGQRPDCSRILVQAGLQHEQTEALGSWATDLNLTFDDAVPRGEVHVAVDRADPSRLLVTTVSTAAPPESNFFAATTDWGQTWVRGVIGYNAGTSYDCDPASYYQRSTGAVYHSKIGCVAGWCPDGALAVMRRSTDDGVTWSDCASRPDTEDLNDRSWMVVDNTPASPCYGNIYMTWYDYNAHHERVARSTDDCATWGSLTNLGLDHTADMSVGPDGTVYVVWPQGQPVTFRVGTSTDCGATWNSGVVRAGFGQHWVAVPAQCTRGVWAQPLVDVDRAPASQFFGRIYVAMFDLSASCGAGPGCSDWQSSCNSDAWLVYSDDQGQSWSTPVSLTAGDGNLVDHFLGYMRVDEADGSVYLSYHRTRLNVTSLVDRQRTFYFVTRSTDGGRSFEPAFQASTVEGDECSPGAYVFERGDYNGLDVHQGVAWPGWIDRRGGGGEEEVVVRKVCFEPAHWSERAPTFVPPALAVGCPGGGLDLSWAAPDLYWGDGGESPESRRYTLSVDGVVVEDNLSWTSTALSGFDPGDTAGHTFLLQAVNQCDVAKAYAPKRFSVANCSPADLGVSVTNDASMVEVGDLTTYVITVTNSGPSAVAGATVDDPFPNQLRGVTWSCTGSGGGVCTASGAGSIVDVVDLPAGGSLVYTATGAVVCGAIGTLVNTATVTHPVAGNDPVPDNNDATDSDTLEPSLFCDDFESGDGTAWSMVVPSP